jgi:glycerol-3-phosphate cytidylyltransferase-like family protein
MGCFALLMPHHVKTLQVCREHCDTLIVLINDDDYTIKKKGCLPLTAMERREILLELGCVDSVKIVSDPDLDRYAEDFFERCIKDSENSLIVFHSHELKHTQVAHLPGAGYADEIMMIENMNGTSVSDVFRAIKGSKDGQ